MPDGNRTTDVQIAQQADAEDRVVVPEGVDCRDSHFMTGSPRRLLVVATGNISNVALLTLIEEHLDAVVAVRRRSCPRGRIHHHLGRRPGPVCCAQGGEISAPLAAT